MTTLQGPHLNARAAARGLTLLGLMLSATLAWPQTRAADEPVPGDYRVEAGRVDRGTYLGWRLFHTTCHGCHGVDGVGTDMAPNLVERVKGLSQKAFATKVLTSYRLVQPPGESKTDDREAALDRLIEQMLRKERRVDNLIKMPAWEDNPLVRPHVLDLYAYLTARGDGKLAPGKPKRLVAKTR
jgi:cytochrome c553